MFGILNETILAIYVLLTKWVRVLPMLLRSHEPSHLTRAHILNVESFTHQIQKNEIVRRLLSYLGVELRLRVPVKVRSDRRCFKRR